MTYPRHHYHSQSQIIDGESSSGVETATVTLSSADILDLHNTPVTLVAAPDEDHWIDALITTVYKKGTTDYTVTDRDPTITYDGASGTLVFVASPTDGDLVSTPLYGTNQSYSPTIADVAGKALVMTVSGALTDGDGTITAFVDYRIREVPA